MPLKAYISSTRFLLISPLESFCSISASSMYGDHNLHQICALIARGEDPNYKCEGKLTPFQTAIAIVEENIAVVQELINAGADVNLADSFLGYTPLHYAVKHGKLHVTIVLLKSGAFINAKDLQGKTPLHYAAAQYSAHFNPWIMKKLLDREDLDYNSVDSNGNTALMLAVKAARSQSVVMLLHHKANPNICNNDMETPLHVAFAGSPSLIENDLLLHGACIYAKDKHGQTPIDILIMDLESRTSTQWIDMLIKIKIIAFKHSASKHLKSKFECVPQLSQFFEECCEEVERMSRDYISRKLTVHDFVSNQLIEDSFDNFNLQIHKLVVERLVRDMYPEYFYDILKIIPRSSLFGTLEIYVHSKNFALIIYLVSNWLTDLDIFRLILAFSNAEITDSMRNLDVREICAIHNFC